MPHRLPAPGDPAGTSLVHPEAGEGPPARRSSGLARLAVALAVLGCSHTEPFPPGSVDNPGPHDGTIPIRLTFDPGVDQFPGWLRDGSGLLYSYEVTTAPDHDRCLGLLPPGGGSRRVEQCATGDIPHDSTNALLSSAAGPGGQVAWVEVVGRRTLAGPQGGGLRVGRLGEGLNARLVQPLPYVSPGGLRHDMATHLAWLGDSALVYLGNELIYFAACSTCKLDTVPAGREIMLLNIGRNPISLEIVPGTFEATSLSVAPDGGVLYFTVAGDSRVYGRVLATGTVAVIHDFGALGIARDVSVNGTSLVAVVGGQVIYYSHPQYGPLQVDQGGTVYHIGLMTGVVTPITTADRLARHPAISPDGRQVAVEITAVAPLGPPDLYLYPAP